MLALAQPCTCRPTRREAEGQDHRHRRSTVRRSYATVSTEHQQIEYSSEIRESSRKALNQSKLGLCSTEKCPQTENTFRMLRACSSIITHTCACSYYYFLLKTEVLVVVVVHVSAQGTVEPDFLMLSSLSRTVKSFVKTSVLFVSFQVSWNHGFVTNYQPRYASCSQYCSSPAGVVSASAS